MPSVWINGELIDESTASISIRDTGLLHAAGVFTTMRAYAGRAFCIQRHLRRVRESCMALQIPLQYPDERLTTAAEEVLKTNGLSDARMRLTVTRGLARQDPIHGLTLQPTVLLTATEMETYPADYYAPGMTVVLIDDQKLNPYDAQAGHKTLNYLSRLLALRDANQRSAGEALWFNVHNYLQSACIGNVFIVKDGQLITPPTPADLRDPEVATKVPYPRSAVLPGVTRSVVIDLARTAEIAVRAEAIDINRLLESDEVFLTNSIMQVMPVCRIERRAIGDDRPGPITRKLIDAYEREVTKPR